MVAIDILMLYNSTGNYGVHPGKEKLCPMKKKVLALAILAITLVLAIAIVIGINLRKSQIPNEEDFILARYEKRESMTERPEGPLMSTQFINSTMQEFLCAGETRQNRVYTPINLYGAIASLAAMFEGETKAQLAGILGEEDIERVRQTVIFFNERHNEAAKEGGAGVSLGSSLWMTEKISVAEEKIKELSTDYCMDLFQGDFTRAKPLAMQWLTKKSLGQSFTMDPLSLEDENYKDKQAAILLSAFAFKMNWKEKFTQENTSDHVFHALQGDMSAPFMSSMRTMTYYRGDHFGAAYLPFEDESYSMWFFLPEEGMSPEELLTDSQFSALLLEGTVTDVVKEEECILHLGIPKFKIEDEVDIKPHLESLGAVDLFDAKNAYFPDFIIEGGKLVANTAKMEINFEIDEKGAKALSFVKAVLEDTPIAGRPVVLNTRDFILDRPFICAVKDNNNVPLLVGIVEEPSTGESGSLEPLPQKETILVSEDGIVSREVKKTYKDGVLTIEENIIYADGSYSKKTITKTKSKKR